MLIECTLSTRIVLYVVAMHTYVYSAITVYCSVSVYCRINKFYFQFNSVLNGATYLLTGRCSLSITIQQQCVMDVYYCYNISLYSNVRGSKCSYDAI